MKSPQTRYRVDERGGRLIVVDRYSGDKPATARDIIGGDQITYARASDAVSGMGSEQGRGRLLGTANSPTHAPAKSAPRQAPVGQAEPTNPWAAPEPAARPMRSPEPFGTASRTSTVLTTKSWYDSKAPRTIVLSAKRSQQALIWTVATVFLIILLGSIFADGFGFFVLMFIAFALLRNGIAPIATKWLDAVERDGLT